MNFPQVQLAKTLAQDRRQFIYFLIFALILLAAGIGLRDPWPADEPRFTLVAKQMVESGEWLIPHRGNELYSDKPPLFMAMQALAYNLTGNWRIAFLLPSLLAALGTLWLMYDLSRRLWGHQAALYGAAALLFTVQFTFQAKKAQIDPTVCFFITAACYGLLRHFLLGPDWRNYWLGCFAAGLGVITKGVGILALFLFLPYCYARWQGWNGLAKISANGWRWLMGVVLFFLAIAAWLVPLLLYVKINPTPENLAYLQDILFRQTAQRYTDSWDHIKPWWYHFGVITLLWAPLSLTYPYTFRMWWGRLQARDARFLLPLTWIVMIILFFSLPAGKRDVYIMPALPVLTMMSAPFLPQALERPRLKLAFFGLILTITTGTLLFGAMVLFAKSGFLIKWAGERGLKPENIEHGWFLLTVGIIGLINLVIFRVKHSIKGLLAALTGIWLLFSFWGYPLLNPSSSARDVMQRTSELIGKQAELGMVAWKEQNLLQADRSVVTFGFTRPFNEQLEDAILWIQQSSQKRWVFILSDAMAPCIDKSKAIKVGHSNRREWWIFQANAILPECKNGNVPKKANNQENNEY